MKMQYKIILISFLLMVFILDIRTIACGCYWPPPSCHICVNGVWVPYGNCWVGCPSCKLCSNCYCTQPGLTGIVDSSHDIAPVDFDVYFTLYPDPGQICTGNVSWSGGGDPASVSDWGTDFTTQWHTPGTYTVIATCCGHNFSKTVEIFDLDLEITGVSEEDEEVPGKDIGVNDDDDNTNCIRDLDENLVLNEKDDLVEIKLSLGIELNSGSAMLATFWENGDCPVKIWNSPTKGTESPCSWDLSVDTLPSSLYVEGYRAGNVGLVFSYNDVLWSDSVVFHVIQTEILKPIGSLNAECNPSSSWLSIPCYHFDFQGLVDGATGGYNLDIEGIVDPSPPWQYYWTLDSECGTLTFNDVPEPEHNPPPYEGEGTLTLDSKLGMMVYGPTYDEKGIKIYLDHLARDYENFGTGGFCKNNWEITTFNVGDPKPVMNDWNCHGSTWHHWDGSTYCSILTLPPVGSPKKTVVITHQSGGGGSHPSLGILNRGDIVAYYQANGPLMHSQTCTGNGTETYGANNEPLPYPGSPSDQSWKWATSPAGDWANDLWLPGTGIMPVTIKVFDKP